MNSTFWTNTIWYIFLGMVSLLEFVFVMVNAKRRGLTFAFFLTILGMTLNFETVILIFMKAYEYHPMILENPPFQFDDELAGNLFSQFSVSATTLLVVVFDLRFFWLLVIGVTYGLIEEIFLHLHVYSHNWYQTWMTVLLIPILFWLAKRMYLKLMRGMKPSLYYGYLFMALFPLNIVILTWGVFALLRIQDFNTTLFLDPIRSRHFLFLIHFWLLSISMMLIYFSRLKWVWKALVIFGVFIVYYIGSKLHLVMIKEGWFLTVSTLSIVWMYLTLFILDKLYGGPQRKSSWLH